MAPRLPATRNSLLQTDLLDSCDSIWNGSAAPRKLNDVAQFPSEQLTTERGLRGHYDEGAFFPGDFHTAIARSDKIEGGAAAGFQANDRSDADGLVACEKGKRHA